MPEYDNRKDTWEGQAQETFLGFQELSEDELLKKILKGEFDMFYTIWQVLWQKWTIEKTAPVLIKLLDSLDDKELFLERYHITENLLKIMKIEDEDLKRDIIWNTESIDVEKKKEALWKIKEELISKVVGI